MAIRILPKTAVEYGLKKTKAAPENFDPSMLLDDASYQIGVRTVEGTGGGLVVLSVVVMDANGNVVYEHDDQHLHVGDTLNVPAKFSVELR